ncbi:MAG: hypothetical protein HDT42_00025 [Ruminococcaceae bacterium]|nr:hypothetical protein [Oscillospiraceae bacterium]
MTAKEINVSDYFKKNNRKFIKFGENFAKLLNDEELINELARKDLEKLAKVWKLVFELMGEQSADNGEKLAELIGVYNDIGKDIEQ